MQLGNNRVWDYVGDNFVHRLLQNKDGKMVEGGPTATKAEGAAMEEKVDSVQLEFTYLLTSQLETQRQYFEDRLARLEQHSVLQTTELREKLGQVSEENAKVKVIFFIKKFKNQERKFITLLCTLGTISNIKSGETKYG